MATFTDDFNRAGPALGSPWATVVGSGIVIDTNEVKAGGAGFCASAVTGETFDDDQDAQITIVDVQDYDFMGVVLRMDGSGNGYVGLAAFGDGRFYLYESTAGTLTSLGFRSVSFAATDTLKAGVVGTTFTLYKNGAAQGATFTDSTHSSGAPGISYQFDDSNLSRGDDFTAEGLAAATASITQTDTTPEDGVQQTVTCANMTGPITAATLGGVSILSDLSGTDPSVAITYTYDASALTESALASRLGEVTLSFSTVADGEVSTTVTRQPKTGWAVSTLASVNLDAGGLGAKLESEYSKTLAITDQIYYGSASTTTITDACVLTTDEESFDLILIQGGSSTESGVATPVTVNAGVEGESPDQFTLGADVTGAELSAETKRSFTSAGLTETITWTATDDAEVSLSENSGYGATVDAGNATEIWCKIPASSSFATLVSGGVTASGVSDSIDVTTRAEQAPELAPTKSFLKTINEPASGQLTQIGGDPIVSWSDPGGVDGAQYTLNDSGVWARTSDNPTIESESFTADATNAAGTSGTQTVTITYGEAGSVSMVKEVTRSITKSITRDVTH